MDPLSPENEMVFMAGPFAGTLVPTSSRLAVLTKSPATGGVIATLVGGGVAAELKYAGYDGLIARGQSPVPVFLYVTDKRVTFERATNLWGMGAIEVERVIQQKKWTHQARVLAIGPDGEKMAPSACITTEGYGRAGWGGVAAVMGSKKLKAIAIKGQAGVQVADMSSFLPYILGFLERADNLVCGSGEVLPAVGDGQARQLQERRDAKDSLGICNLWHCSLETLSELYARVTGSSLTPSEILLSGERVRHLAELLCAKERHTQLYYSPAACLSDARLGSGRDALSSNASMESDHRSMESSRIARVIGMDAGLLCERGVEG